MSDEPPPPAEQDVRAPILAIVGVAVVVLTIVAAVIGVVIAVGRLGDESGVGSAVQALVPALR